MCLLSYIYLCCTILRSCLEISLVQRINYKSREDEIENLARHSLLEKFDTKGYDGLLFLYIVMFLVQCLNALLIAE